MQVLGTRQHLSRDSSNSPTPQYETGFSQHRCLKANLSKGTSQKYKWVTLDPVRGEGRRSRWLGRTAAISQAAPVPVLFCTSCTVRGEHNFTIHSAAVRPHTSSRMEPLVPGSGILRNVVFVQKPSQQATCFTWFSPRTQSSSPLWKENGLLTTYDTDGTALHKPAQGFHGQGRDCTGFSSPRNTKAQWEVHPSNTMKTIGGRVQEMPSQTKEVDAYRTTSTSSSLWSKPVVNTTGTGVVPTAPV